MRLVVLMVEVEQPEGISARKLILETVRHNVITAYSGKGAVELLRRFPNGEVAVVHTELESSSCATTVAGLKEVRPDLPIIAISPRPDQQLAGVDYVISSYEPQVLLALLAKNFEAATSEGIELPKA
jgi:DNA-binding response OmpR family regulator